MILPNFIIRWLRRWFCRVVYRRHPDVIIGHAHEPYLKRWMLFQYGFACNIYFHMIERSDDDRALHDHPWHFISIILLNGYEEITKSGSRFHPSGSMRFHHARHAHRLVIDAGFTWTIVIRGPSFRRWGFYCKKGWVYWRDFVDPKNTGLHGAGCGE